MALFKRDKRETPPEPSAETEAEPVVEAPASEEPVPHVNISVTTFGKPATPPRVAETAPAAEAPAAGAAATPQMPPNAVLRSALKDVPAQPEAAHVIGAMRQALQGHLYLRISGNAQELLAQKKPLAPAVSTIRDKRYLLAFTGVDALRDSVNADGDTNTSAIAQPVTAVFANVLQSGHAGIILDHATEGARIVLPAPLIEKSIEEADPDHTVKTLLSRVRTDDTAVAVADALTRVKVWVAGRQTEAGMGMAEVHAASGERRLEVYSHPLEVLAMGRGDRPLSLEPAQLAAVLSTQQGLSGIVIDPAGPWIEISREQLAPVIALAPETS